MTNRGAPAEPAAPAVMTDSNGARGAGGRCLDYFFLAFPPRPLALWAGAFLPMAFLLADFFAPFAAFFAI